MASYSELDWQLKWGIPVVVVGLAVVAGITGLLVGGNGKFSGVTEAVGTANAVLGVYEYQYSD